MNCNVKTRMAWKEAVLEIFCDTRQGKGTIDKIIEKTRDREINSVKNGLFIIFPDFFSCILKLHD